MRRLFWRSLFRRLFATVACRRLLQLIRGWDTSSASVYSQSFRKFFVDNMKTRNNFFFNSIKCMRLLNRSDDNIFWSDVMMWRFYLWWLWYYLARVDYWSLCALLCWYWLVLLLSGRLQDGSSQDILLTPYQLNLDRYYA